MADVEIHRRTNNRYGLQDALRGIVRGGGNMEHDWPLTRALKVGDEVTGVPVLMESYNQMKATPVTPDLSALWRELGVRPSDDSVVFDQGAPLASVVRSIMATRSRPGDACVHMRAEAESIPGSTANSVSFLKFENAVGDAILKRSRRTAADRLVLIVGCQYSSPPGPEPSSGQHGQNIGRSNGRYVQNSGLPHLRWTGSTQLGWLMVLH